MKFEFKHGYDVPVEELERVLFHDDLSALLKERMGTIIDVEPLSVSRNGDRMERRVRYLPVPMIKSVGPIKIEPEWMEWYEESTYDFKTHSGQFKNVAARRKIAGILHNVGTLEIRPDGRGGSVEYLRGELKVKVFMVGRIAEKVIHSNAMKILSEQARVVGDVIRDKAL
jgi:hypothetical protein